jgi:hypothetical protein
VEIYRGDLLDDLAELAAKGLLCEKTTVGCSAR